MMFNYKILLMKLWAPGFPGSSDQILALYFTDVDKTPDKIDIHSRILK